MTGRLCQKVSKVSKVNGFNYILKKKKSLRVDAYVNPNTWPAFTLQTSLYLK